MRVLVTGASGFIGSSFVRYLLSRGYSVIAVHRKSKVPEVLSSLLKHYPENLSIRVADLSFPDSCPDIHSSEMVRWLAESKDGIPSWHPELPIAETDLLSAIELMKDADVCVHCAGKVDYWGGIESYYPSNVNSVRVLQAASEKSAKERFVLLSSLSVHGFGGHRLSDETGPYYRANHTYQISKRLAESLVSSTRTMILRPGDVYGPGDTTVLYRMFDVMKRGMMVTLAGGRRLTCPVYIDDLCAAIEGSLVAPMPELSSDRVFNIVADSDITWREFVETSLASLQVPSHWIDLPVFLAWLAAVTVDSCYRIARAKKSPPISLYMVQHVARDFSFSHARASAVLGYQPKMKLKDGLAASAMAYREKPE